MKALYLHAKEFGYIPREPVKGIVRDEVEETERIFNDVLVVFISIEKGDWERREELGKMFLNDLTEQMERLSVDNLVIYPYAHLSDNLEEPRRAFRLLKYLENIVKDKVKELHRAPFGWYKEFKIHVYGHPLAELSRRF